MIPVYKEENIFLYVVKLFYLFDFMAGWGKCGTSPNTACKPRPANHDGKKNKEKNTSLLQ